MLRTTTVSTRTYTLFPYPPLFRSPCAIQAAAPGLHRPRPAQKRDGQGRKGAAEGSIRRGVCAVTRSRAKFDQILPRPRSEEHTSELQSLMRNSYDAFCLKKQTRKHHQSVPLRHYLHTTPSTT